MPLYLAYELVRKITWWNPTTQVSETHTNTCYYFYALHDYFMYQTCMFITHMKYILN